MLDGLDDFDALRIISAASNLRSGDNPPYTRDDFLAMYPQFMTGTMDGMKKVTPIPMRVIDVWVQVAHASILESRWHELWELAMGLFIAHHLTLFLDATKKNGDGMAKGLPASKSAGDLSISYDFGTVSQDMQGWGAYKLTTYGQQLVTLAKTCALGGMGVW